MKVRSGVAPVRLADNVRELRNFCENIVILKRGSEVTEYDLDLKYHASPSLVRRMRRGEPPWAAVHAQQGENSACCAMR